MPGALGTATTDLLPQLEVLTAVIDVGLDIFYSCLIMIYVLKGLCFCIFVTTILQGPIFFNCCLTLKSSRASAPAPSPWSVGILQAMATPDRRPETLTTSSSEQIFFEFEFRILLSWWKGDL